ncbi:hypothetical protein CR513_33677, partial [Mucuna pruriens]
MTFLHKSITFMFQVQMEVSTFMMGSSLRRKNLCILKSLAKEVLTKEAHEGGLIGHFGEYKTYKTLLEHFFWPHMNLWRLSWEVDPLTIKNLVSPLRMTRKRNCSSLHPFDPGTEKTLNRIRKSKNMHVVHSSDSFSFIPKTGHFEIKPNFADNPLFELEPMENNDRTLKELATPNVLYQPWCIQYPLLESA